MKSHWLICSVCCSLIVVHELSIVSVLIGICNANSIYMMFTNVDFWFTSMPFANALGSAYENINDVLIWASRYWTGIWGPGFVLWCEPFENFEASPIETWTLSSCTFKFPLREGSSVIIVSVSALPSSSKKCLIVSSPREIHIGKETFIFSLGRSVLVVSHCTACDGKVREKDVSATWRRNQRKK